MYCFINYNIEIQFKLNVRVRISSLTFPLPISFWAFLLRTPSSKLSQTGAGLFWGTAFAFASPWIFKQY